MHVDATDQQSPPVPGGRRGWLRIALGGVALSLPLPGLVQVQRRPARIGFLAADASSARVNEGFRIGMRDLGLVEARDFVVQWRFADGGYERLAIFAAELVRLNADVIVAVSTLSVQAAHRATQSIPIVMIAVADPVGEGFAISLARPGRNITGLCNIGTEVAVKHLELLHAAVPKLSRVAVLINPLNPSDALILEQIDGAAYARGLKVLPVEASTPGQVEMGFEVMTRARAGGVIVAEDSFFESQRQQIADLGIKSRIPTICSNREMTEAGGLMSYGQNLAEHYRRAASYVDKIVKGAKPAELPIEQPRVIEFVINRATAKALGLRIPRDLELRADRVID